MILVIFLFIVYFPYCYSVKNNVCPTFDDYYTIKNSSRCWYDLAAENDAPSIIKLYGYPLMEYKVPTADGFILTMFRIPSKSPAALKRPIYLQHGLVATCAYFLGLGKDSLAFVLADAGFDVWLGNYRGNQYSEDHVNLTVFDTEYWEHSMDDIVKYDFPALFSTILSNSDPNGKIIYLGHSLGTTLSLMYAAEYPEIARDTLEMLILMSPAYTLSGMISPYKKAAPFGNIIISIARHLKMFRIVSQAETLREGVRTMCLESPPLMQLCLQLYNLFYGANTVLGAESIPVYFQQLPGGTALKILNHAADLVLGNFRKYNHFEKNFEIYGSFWPPIYDIKKLLVPVHLVYSTQDWATSERDAINLWNNLPTRSRYKMRRIDLPAFNHIDFVFGRNAREIVYEYLVQELIKIIKL